MMAYLIASSVDHPGPEVWFGYTLTTCLALNFVYLLLNEQKLNRRIFRLVGLWFDAKENELRKRANQSRPGE
jgi:hypothetical protein